MTIAATPPKPFSFGRVLTKEYSAGLRLERHAHDYHAAILVLAGTFRERCAGRMDSRQPGWLRTMPRDCEHSNEYGDQGATSFLIQVHDDDLPPSDKGPTLFAAPCHFAPGSRLAALVQTMQEEFRVPDDLTGLALDGLFLQLLAVSRRAGRSDLRDVPPPWLRKVRERLVDEARRPPSMGVLASDAGVHAGHLSRAFRGHFGCSPSAFVLRIRVEWAKQRLTGSGDSISRIAIDAGFYDHAHFARRFRQIEGCTPQQYRVRAFRVSGRRRAPAGEV